VFFLGHQAIITIRIWPLYILVFVVACFAVLQLPTPQTLPLNEDVKEEDIRKKGKIYRARVEEEKKKLWQLTDLLRVDMFQSTYMVCKTVTSQFGYSTIMSVCERFVLAQNTVLTT
jgi:hypothetical protein